MKKQIILATLTLFLALTVCSAVAAVESTDNSTNSTMLGQATDQNSFVAGSNSRETNSSPENLTNNDSTSITSTLVLDPGVSNISQGTLPDPQIWRNGVYVDTYTTIQAAIDAAQNSDTIMLEDGATFYEHDLFISKKLDFNVLNGGHATIDAQNLGRIFNIDYGVTVNLYNLTLQNGKNSGGGAIINGGILTVTNNTFTLNTATRGGAIRNGGTLTITSSIFTNNTTNMFGGAIFNDGNMTVTNSTFIENTANQDGGAILNNGTLNISNNTFINNKANNNGGALFNEGVSTLTGSTLTNNTAIYYAGAVFNVGTLNVTGSTFTDNTSDYGGAILNINVGTLNVTGSTFTGNTANYYGGAIANDHGTIFKITNSTFTENLTAVSGGAIYNYHGNSDDPLNLTDSNFTSNTASNGAAIYNDSGIFNITTTTFTNNTASIANRGSVISTYTGFVQLNFNRIIGNSNPAVTSWGRLIDATLNWWGSNESPVGEVSVNVDYDPWIFLTVTADPSSINIGETSMVTADLLHDSTYDPTNPDASYHDPGNGHVPEALLTLGSDPDWGTRTYNPGSGWIINGNYTADGLVPIPPSVRVYAYADDEHTVYSDIIIKNLNAPPVLDPIGDKSVDENQKLEFTINATDPDGDILTYSASNLPQGATFNTNSGAFSWTPDYTQSGVYTVTFTVSDGSLTDSEDVSITVNNMNRPPVLDEIGPKTVNENETLQFTVTGNDPDGDNLTYTASNLPNGATFNNGVFKWTPDYTQSRLYTVTFTVFDGNLIDSEDVSIIVNNVNRAPSASINDSYFVNLPITMRVAGIPGNKITLEIVQEGLVITSASLIKETGLFKDQEIKLSTKIDLSKPFSGRLLFEAGSSGWGANPVWLIIDGKKTLITTL